MLPSGSGTKADSEKPMMDLLDPAFLVGVSKVMTFGAKKYDANNWRKGIKVSRIIAACQRHLCAINAGETDDPETGLQHAYHLGCETMFLASMLATQPEMDDRWVKPQLQIERRWAVVDRRVFNIRGGTASRRAGRGRRATDVRSWTNLPWMRNT